MSPERWHRVGELASRAWRATPPDLSAWLTERCGGDETLRHEVEAVLAADASGGDWLQPVVDRPPLADEFDEAPGPAGEARVGRQLGPYRVLWQIGVGGMSRVFLAERDDGTYRQQVAIKVIEAHAASNEAQLRFLQERQILAGLDHPHIARLIDGGTDESGLPYLVMEYVEGLAIGEYCQRHALTLDRRLQLFRTVCSAVSYAHQNLVVHRDLKPSNVLVTADGQPKLLDFGIAKWLNAKLSSGQLRSTQPSLRPMTPIYASPEQVLGESITTASDVYSLGVVLYELLTGCLPYEIDAEPTPEALMRVNSDQPPRPPSHAAADTVEPIIPGRLLRGDLDDIVLMSLRKEPGRRYASVLQLSDDLRRHLEHQPVRARPDTWIYRVSKGVQRQPLAVALAFLVLMFAAAMTVQSLRLASALERVETQRSRAERVSAFLVDLFRVADPGTSQGTETTAREILDHGALEIGLDLHEEPGVRAALLDTLGSVYRNLGLFEEAGTLLEQALALRRQRADGATPDVAESLEHLAFLRFSEGSLESAESLAQESLAMRLELYGEDHPKVAAAWHNLAELQHARGRHGQAEVLYRRALDVRRRHFGEQSREVAESLSELALLLHDTDAAAEGETMARDALVIWQRLYDGDHPQIANNLGYLALLVAGQGRLDEAEVFMRDALTMRQRLYGDDHPEVATAANDLGTLLWQQGELQSANHWLRTALEIRQGKLRDSHPLLGTNLNDLALVLADQGKPTAALGLLREALGVYQRAFASDHPAIFQVWMNLARVETLRGDEEAALGSYARAAEMGRRVWPQGSWPLAWNLLVWGRTLAERGDAVSAVPKLRESLAILHRVLPGHWRVSQAQAELGLCLATLGHASEAESLLRGSQDELTENGEDQLAQRVRDQLARLRPPA